MRHLRLALAFCGSIHAQQTAAPLLSDQQLLDLYAHAVQLMEATTVSTPALSSTGAFMLADARQTLGTLRIKPWDASVNHTFLCTLRAYVALADAVPKPYPFPKTARDQFVELRDDLERADIHFSSQLEAQAKELRSPDPAEVARYTDENARVGRPKAGNRRIIFFGDSITDGWRLNEYFPEKDFLNRGISGQTTGQMLQRFQADVVNLKPDAVLILAGTNDIARGIPLTAIESNLTVMGDLAGLHDIRVIVASLTPVNDAHKDENPLFQRTLYRPPSSIRQLNQWIQGFCSARKYAFVDYYGVMIDSSGALKPEYSDDGLHPNSAGYRMMAPLALAAIDQKAPAALQQKPNKRRLHF